MNAPLISIVLPCYNSAAFLQETLDSLSAQTLADFECIAIDDGSSDNTLAILQAHAARDARFSIISRENRGLIATLNEGIALARGAWLARMDADDLAEPQRLQIQLDTLNATGADVCGTWVQFFGERSGVWQTPLDDAAIKLQLLFNVAFAHPSVMARTEVLRQVPYDAAATHAEDYALWCALAARGARFVNVAQPLLRYRCHAGQITQTRRDALRQTAQRIRASYAPSLLPAGLQSQAALFAEYAEPGRTLTGAEFAAYADMLLAIHAAHPGGVSVLGLAWLEGWQRTVASAQTLAVARRLQAVLPVPEGYAALYRKQWFKHRLGRGLLGVLRRLTGRT
ncbi:glycosyltransferase family 2 protein [Silvimonas iriomotensis]|uniref:Glycosyltransferase 2-like domain-containing protein n=1 Tax=Silvimonas iriomotensis TaxID=449662 RepID=A0ABQ2PB78_9NEIS|nr:glycosyltransferase family 2 protein [Silvimonas iriomotensis]GGP22804.1 hypothetical protein GCM10010970_28040 [Silvimonas iriomotensis]